MKKIEEILKGIGVEIPEEHKATFDKEWKENYRTIAELEKVTAKRDELKTELESVQEQLKTFDGVDVEGFKSQISDLTTQLEEAKTARAADEAKHQLESTVEKFMGDKQFVNSLTADSIRSKLMEELDKDTAKGKSIDDIFKGLVSDKDGNQLPNILVDQEQEKANQNKATFTQPMGKKPEPGSKLDLGQLMKMKNENPDFDVKSYLQNNQN